MIIQTQASFTGQYLQTPLLSVNQSKKVFNQYLTVKQASKNNLKKISLSVPLESFVAVTGVSGSGKTSLVFEVIAKEATDYFQEKKSRDKQQVNGFEAVTDVVVIDHQPVGRSSRSTIATYTEIFTDIRKLYGQLSTNFTAKYFSTNTSGGRCEECQGNVFLSIPMHFLPAVETVCPVCQRKRYQETILNIKYKGYNISDILTMDVSRAKKILKKKQK